MIATRLIEHRLRALVDEQPESERERAHDLVRRVAHILGIEGSSVERPAPRWALIEVRDTAEMPRQRIRPLE